MRVYYVAKHAEEPTFFGEDEAAARAAASEDDCHFLAFEGGQCVEASEGTTFLTRKRCFTTEQQRLAAS